MIKISADVLWKRAPDAKFTDLRFSRAHHWHFDGGADIPASSSPHVVPIPYSAPENVDPEEAYVAALSSCHMLTFLYVAAKKGFVIDEYHDAATAVMEKNEQGQLVVSKVTLNPVVTWSGNAPDRETEEALHHRAHADCFLANSVRSVIETNLGGAAVP
jgi:organic hydroperoxide reductase OsmC/OhrA